MAALNDKHAALARRPRGGRCPLGLDSFRFQARIIHMEHASLLATLEAIDRNMYYECYRLHKDVQAYAEAEVASPVVRGRMAVSRSYPSYSHLQKDMPCDFHTTAELHGHVVQAIRTLGEHHEQVEAQIAQDASDSALGLNIDNLVNSSRFQNRLLAERIRLFTEYLGVYNDHHRKFLRRASRRAQMVLSAVSRDVQMSGFDRRRAGARPPGSSSSSGDDAPSSDDEGAPGAIPSETGEGAGAAAAVDAGVAQDGRGEIEGGEGPAAPGHEFSLAGTGGGTRSMQFIQDHIREG